MWLKQNNSLCYIYYLNTSVVRCNAYIKAVNGAGESDPSNNVTISSLPLIALVTAFLSMEVWWRDHGQCILMTQ